MRAEINKLEIDTKKIEKSIKFKVNSLNWLSK